MSLDIMTSVNHTKMSIIVTDLTHDIIINMWKIYQSYENIPYAEDLYLGLLITICGSS